MNGKSTLFALAGLLVGVGQSTGLTASRNWVGLGGNGLWNTAANWSGSIPPGTTNDLIFSSASPQMATINNLLLAAHSITFGVGGYSVTGNTLILTNGIMATNTTGGNVYASEIMLAADQSFTNLNPGTQLAFGILELNGNGATFRGAGTNFITNAVLDTPGGGGLTNLGTGIFLLSGSNSLTSPTALGAGTNIINAFHRRSPITWTAGTLGGTGHLGQVTASGASAKQLAPGYGGTGILEISNLVLNSSVTVAMQVNGTSPGTNHDQLIVTNGDLTIGSATLSLSFLSTLTNAVGDTITLIKLPNPTNVIIGTFTNAPEGTIFNNNGYAYQLSYTGGDGNDVTLTASVSTGDLARWDGGATTNAWMNPTNWAVNTAPVEGDGLWFPAPNSPSTPAPQGTNRNDFPSGTTFDNLFFSGPSGTTFSNILFGNSFRLNNGIRLAPPAPDTLTCNGRVTISNHIALNFSQLFTNRLDTQLFLSGGIDLSNKTLTVDTRPGGAFIFFDSPITGSGDLVIQGDEVFLRASNAITGTLLVNSALLTVTHPQALGTAASGPILVSSNAVLRLQASNSVFTGSSIFLSGRLELAVAPNTALSAPLTIVGSNTVFILTNTLSFGTNFTLQGPITNSTQVTNTGFGGPLRIGTNSTIQGGGTLYNTTSLDVDGTVHNTLNNSFAFGNLSGSGQIDTLISSGGSITPGSASDTKLAFNPLRVGTLTLGGSSSAKLQFSLFPNRPGGGPTNTAIITTNAPTLGVSTLKLIALTNLAPSQKFTILRNDSASPVTNTFFNFPEGSVIAVTNGNFAVSISYSGGDGNDTVLTVLSNTPPTFATPTNNFTITETTTLTYPNVVTDIETPPQPMTWTLLTPFAGLTLNATNGVLTWVPTEAEGPSTNTLLVKVTDSGAPPLSSTGTVVVTIQEINQRPVPDPVPNTNIFAGNILTIQMTATDADIPANPLTWQLVSNVVAGASITTNGLYTYASSIFDVGLKTNWVKLFDTNAAAINQKSLASTNIFVVNVLMRRIVTNTNDSGPGSLRQALLDSETNSAGCTIQFNILGSGPFKIPPTNQLPLIGPNTYLDGYTQPGSHPNTLTNGTDATILIELSGENQNSGNGLILGSSGITVRGLCINRFSNGYPAVVLGSCCGSGGFCDTSGDALEGCFIGTDTSGTVALPNSHGVDFSCAHNSRVGGADIAQRNLISGNLLDAVDLDGHPANPTIQNNLIGTDRTGTNPLPNGRYGLSVGTDGGGFSSCLIADNVIGSSAQYGLVCGAPNLTVVRNKIGVGADGATPLGNGINGVYLSNNGHVVGGTNSANANTIAYNIGFGVDIFGANVTVLGNSIFRNTSRGIKLESGANNNQSAPVVNSATPGSDNLTIAGTLTSRSNTTYRIEFFYSPDFAPSNAPQAWIFIGFTNVTTGSSSNANFSVTFNQSLSDGFITATATDPAGNTSGISDGLAFSGSPRIGITRSGSQIRLVWLTNFTAFVLQSNANLTQPNTWSNVAGSPSVIGTNFFLDIPRSESRRFFRLRSP